MNNDGKKYNFLQLINEYEIEIPKIQRDYIQGRKTHRVQTNRKRFVENLSGCFKGDEISLNFIYGIAENGKFIPIDGQQRLTTLFILTCTYTRKRDFWTNIRTCLKNSRIPRGTRLAGFWKN